MPIVKVLDITTGHLKSTDDKLLHQHVGDAGIFHCSALPGGWYVSTAGWNSPDADDGIEARSAAARAAGFSEEFIALMVSAVERDVHAIQFDRDGTPEPGFVTFDWENEDAIEFSSGMAPR